MLQDHYRHVRERRGYDPVTDPVLGLQGRFCRRRFAFTTDGAALAAVQPADTLVSTGISMTGPPHAGTLAQLRTALACQRAGVDVQLVLADLVVWSTRDTHLSSVRHLAEQYRRYAIARGFDERFGRIQIQSETPAVLETALRVARDYDPATRSAPFERRTAFERTLEAAYADVGHSNSGTAFAEGLVRLLLIADTLHPLRTGGAETVVLVLGADNVGLARTINAAREAAGFDGAVIGLYTRLVPGLAGVPKMSKSIPRSNLTLGMAANRLRERVREIGEPPSPECPTCLAEMVEQASPYRPPAPPSTDRGEETTWCQAVETVGAWLAEQARLWSQTESPVT